MHKDSAHDERVEDGARANIYEGIDFANKEENIGHCYVSDDGHVLSVSFEQPDHDDIVRTAVDCPFGTTVGFSQLLQGELPEDDGDGFQVRSTEKWLREHLGEYRTNQRWREREKEQRKQYPRTNYFHPTRHVQPTLGLRMVPACVHWLGQKLAAGNTTEEWLAALASARRGEAAVVEAHPRLFMYSIAERILRREPSAVTIPILNHIAGYKKLPSSRCKVYCLLRDHVPAWSGQTERTLEPMDPPMELLATDHAFDAWLCALTAWLHHNKETITWTGVPGLCRDVVDIEGHILILQQEQLES